jgi:hypothetical protein
MRTRPADKTADWQRGHRSYFPGTVVDNSPDNDPLKGSETNRASRPGSSIGSLATQFNACDVDYGDRLDAWRRQIADETVRSFFWYLSLVETAVLIILGFYTLYLLREQELRHIVVVDIVCQLYNSWAYSDRKARTLISQHNRWMREVNETYEQQLRGGGSQEAPYDVSVMNPASQSSVPESSTPDSVGIEKSESEIVSGGTKKTPIPSIAAAENFGLGTPQYDAAEAAKQDVNAALAQVNQSAANAAAESEAKKELERAKAKLKAIEEQNAALKKMLNEQREREIVEEINPYGGGGL